MTEQRRIEMPDGFPWSRLKPLWARTPDGRYRIDVDSAFRVKCTRNDPLLFALIYMTDYITLPRPGYRLVAPSEWHFDLIYWARSWMTPGPSRHAWVVPRKGGKSAWGCAPILPLWALAHKHRSFFVVFSYNAGQAKIHLQSIRREITGNERLLTDFPELAYASGDAENLHTASGQHFLSRGMDCETRGLKIGADLPDLIAIDDGEPSEATYAKNYKASRLGTLKQAILPLNELAVVAIYGTTTKYGSWAHDVVLDALGERTAPWIAETGFECHYYPAIMDEGTPDERSLWPQKWHIDWLKDLRKRDNAAYAMEYQNRPEAATTGEWWTKRLLHVDRHFRSVEYVMTIDTAVTEEDGSDETVIAITGIDKAGQQVCVEHVWGGRIDGHELRDEVHRLKRLNPRFHKVYLEANNGGNRWEEIMRPMPPGTELILSRPNKRGSKRNRFEWLLALHKRGGIVYREEFKTLFDQMIAYPRVEHDDQIDAVEAGAAFHFELPME